jgi:hypothetical protein
MSKFQCHMRQKSVFRAFNAEAEILYTLPLNTVTRRKHSNFQHAMNQPNYAYTVISHVQWPLRTGSL